MLHVIDSQWKDHLLSMDHLKEGIGLRGYGQRDPLTEYKREAYDLFEDMVDRVRTKRDRAALQTQVAARKAPEPAPSADAARPAPRPRPATRGHAVPRHARAPARGRVDGAQGGPGPTRPFPCGSGKKSEKCCCEGAPRARLTA